MNIKKMKRWIAVGCYLVVILSLVTSCTQNAQEAKEEKAKPKAQAEKRDKIPASEKGLPQPKGGSERNHREINPVSNNYLQQKYPSTLVLRGSLQDKRVALTFDDGPDRRFTPEVLDVLKKHNVPATFFLMGSRARALPEVTKRISVEGHAIGNHTYWHPKLYKESKERMRWEVNETEKALEQIIGYKTRLFRAPYGGLTEELVEEMGRMNLSVVGWSVDSLDWMQLSSEEVQKNVLSNVHPGAIILMHSGGHWTQDLSGMVKSLDVIIPELKKDGIKFVTVPELLNISERKSR
jgi:peptidoglycan/xylan/chitin deacetylase (PgdA/CDA1 family)